MEEKLLYSSKGGNKIVEFIYFVFGGLVTLVGLLTVCSKAIELDDNTLDILVLLFGIFVTAYGTYGIICGIACKQSYLRVYENYIEAKDFNLFAGGQSDIIIKYSDIHGVGSKGGGMITLLTTGKTKQIFVPKANEAQQIISQQLNKK